MLSAHDKLDLFFNMLVKVNNLARLGTGGFIHHKGVSFLNVELGMNKSRDIAPYLEENARFLKSHYEGGEDDFLITKEVMKHHRYSAKDEKGRSIYITELMKRHGIAEIFGR